MSFREKKMFYFTVMPVGVSADKSLRLIAKAYT